MPEPYVSIPETITVHLGAPSADAQNITVPFADYIKNVASSEIYPTWPEQAIRANVYAQMSYVLNRVFTEWYRAQGYDFDITNSTRYDQSFVPGRDIFENISTIVDDMMALTSPAAIPSSRCSRNTATARPSPVRADLASGEPCRWPSRDFPPSRSCSRFTAATSISSPVHRSRPTSAGRSPA